MSGETPPGGPRYPLREIVRSGLLAVLAHPLSTVVTVGCLAAMLIPFTAALGISRGVADQAMTAVDRGADLHVTGERYGRAAPLPLGAAEVVAAVPGVQAVEPRIVGSALIGAEARDILVLGVADGRLPSGSEIAVGSLWRPGKSFEVVIGTELARRLALGVGDAIPPFYRNPRGEKVVRVVGIVQSDLPVWQAEALITSYETAAEIFAERGTATSLLVRCPAGYQAPVRAAILRLPSLAPAGEEALLPRVVSRDQLRAQLVRRTGAREGALAVLHVLAFVVGVPLLLATTGLGLAARRREVALLKALGWRTDQVVARSLAESTVLATLGVSISLIVVWTWIRLAGGGMLARLLLPAATYPDGFPVPFRLAPEPLLLTVAAAFVVTATGSLLSSWRAASAEPAEALR